MARPNWEYVRVDVLLPDNPKLDGLSAAAKWTLIELWCYCGQHLTDGFVRDAKWKTFGARRDREALVAAGLIEPADGGWQVHDYTGGPNGHQRSRAEVLDLKEKRRKAGEKGGRAKASATADAVASARASASPPDPVDNHESTALTAGYESKTNQLDSPDSSPNGNGHPDDSRTSKDSGPYQVLGQVLKQTASKSVAEAEAEAEEDLVMADAGDQSSRRNARDNEIDLIVEEIRKTTGRVVSFEWAHSIRALVLGGRQVSDRLAYLRETIQSESNPRTRFLPVTNDLPSARSMAEAERAAGLTPGHRPASEEAKAAAVELARRAFTERTA